MTYVDAPFNPFPGLRPFEPDEDHLFFGREQEVDELLRRLRFNRFLSVVGTSGCGKSSLIRCGLIPSLQGGMMARAGSSWRISIFRPGEDPLRHLAEALDAPDVIGSADDHLASPNRVLIEATLRRGPRGLVEAVQHARIPREDNLLVVVDQFEELFRFHRHRLEGRSRGEAVSFVKLLLEAVSQKEIPIYVVITMRSDFIGDCMEYPGLPEALNDSQYLVPRMTRDELRAAITGPIAVAGGQIAQRLVLRLMNDLGTDQDQLPILQHALMRTWEHWAKRRQAGDPIDIQDYEAVGTLREALSIHAEEAYAETGSDHARRVTEWIFKALTDKVTDPRGTRRPCSIRELAAVAEAPEQEIIDIVEIFRKPGRSFLMPPADVRLDRSVIVDLSHESLMRCWTRLARWAEEERVSAARYLRLSKAAAWFEEGTGGLLEEPALSLGLSWRAETRPSSAWAHRYDESFERAMRFLDRSKEERDRVVAERRAQKRRDWRRLQWTAAMLAVLLLIAVTMAVVAWRQGARARAENARAEENLRLARMAVDVSLGVTDREPSQLAADFPEFVRFRRQLLEEAHRFYREFVTQAPANDEIRGEMAFATIRLAHIDRALGDRDRAAERYRQAIADLESLTGSQPANRAYRQALGNAYNWLGETQRAAANRFDDARDAYGRALSLQNQLVKDSPDDVEYRRELARTHYNRGILSAQDASQADAAETDFRAAIALLEPLAAGGGSDEASQELGRAYNNLGSLLASEVERAPQAREPYTRAVAIHEGLLAREPGNREYALELVKFYNNIADLLRESGESDSANARNRQALALIDVLSRPAPSLSIERADSYNLRGRILQSDNPAGAVVEYRRALELYRNIEQHERASRLADFHLRFGDLLVNLAFLQNERPVASGAQDILAEAVEFYLAVARRSAGEGTPGEARSVLDTLANIVPVLPDQMRRSVDPVVHELTPKLRSTAASES